MKLPITSHPSCSAGPRVVKKLKRADGPPKYEFGTLKMVLFSAELSGWQGEYTDELALNYDDTQQFPSCSKELTS